jgi:hypothetical protein
MGGNSKTCRTCRSGFDPLAGCDDCADCQSAAILARIAYFALCDRIGQSDQPRPPGSNR